MPRNTRRNLITGTVAAMAAGAATSSAQTKPEKKVIRSGPKPATRSKVSCSKLLSPNKGTNCLGKLWRLSGHKRVPEPPHSTTG